MSLLKRLKFKNLRYLSSINKGLTYNPNINHNTDLLNNNLKGSKSIDEVFQLVNSHYNIMSSQHVMQALKTIFVLQKRERKFNSSQNEILTNPTFEKLCSKLSTIAGSIEADEALDAIKVLTLLNVPPTSKIYQMMLQLLRHSINDFSLNQIVFLNFLLSKVEKATPLIEAFQLALPMAFDLQVPVKLDTSNTKLLVDCLYFASRNNVSKQCVELITNALLKHRLNEKAALSIVWSICDLPPGNYTEAVLKKGLKIIIPKISSWDYNEIESTLTKLTDRFSSRNPYFYNQEFYDCCANYIVDNDTGFENGIHFLRKVLKTGYFNPEIFEYVLNLCKTNPDLLRLGDPTHVYILICTAALTNYHSENLNFLRQLLLNFDHKFFMERFIERINLLRYATSLCILDVYSLVVLEKIFNRKYLEGVSQKRFIHDVENILLLSQLIKLYKPEFNYLLPDDEWLNSLRKSANLITEFPLEGLLNTIFGGKKFVRTNVISKMHHTIDHVIVLRKGGFPVHIDTNAEYVEDIQSLVDSKSQMILILALPLHRYSLRTKIMRATAAMTIKTLEETGYTVVPIDIEAFKICQDHEKIPYVIDQIKSKTDYMEQLSSFL